MRPQYVRDELVREAVLTTPNGKMEFMVDGDLESFRGPVSIKLGPAVRFVTRW